MGLENFTSDSNEDEEVIDISSEVETHKFIDDEVAHLIGQINQFDKRKEEAAHYNSKVKSAITLAKEGYTVYIEETFIEDSKQRADIYAVYNERKTGDDQDSGVTYNEMIVEVGEYDASRAKNAMDHVDCIILVPKGLTIGEGLLVTENDFISSPSHNVPEELRSTLNNDIYTNVDGVPFIPDVDSLYLDRYEEICSVIISEITDASGMTDEEIINSVNSLEGADYSENDILKVADEIGLK
jgi:hypothetical protein